MILYVSLVFYFIAFYSIGQLAGQAINRRRLVQLQNAAQIIPEGINSISAKLLSPAGSLGLRQKLVEAGRPRGLDVDGLMVLKVIFSLGGIGLAALISILFRLGGSQIVSLVILCAVGGFFAPNLWLERRIQARRKEITLALPDILDMLTISVEAGLGFDAALAKVVKNFRGALSEELFRFLQETQLGQSKKVAWRALAARTNVPEVNSFVLAILQADAFGISIGKVLRVQADEMRVKRRQRAEEIAMKAPVKVVFPLVLCIFPALMTVILGPAIVQIATNFIR
ncbi:MAG: type II secretion system F family protein [Actinomycetota bacterium]|nr:type II secretion system F family protein [Actinomycetota bacterium]